MEKRKGFEIILICSSCPAAAAGMRELCDNWQLGQRGGKWSIFYSTLQNMKEFHLIKRIHTFKLIMM